MAEQSITLTEDEERIVRAIVDEVLRTLRLKPDRVVDFTALTGVTQENENRLMPQIIRRVQAAGYPNTTQSTVYHAVPCLHIER